MIKWKVRSEKSFNSKPSFENSIFLVILDFIPCNRKSLFSKLGLTYSLIYQKISYTVSIDVIIDSKQVQSTIIDLNASHWWHTWVNELTSTHWYNHWKEKDKFMKYIAREANTKYRLCRHTNALHLAPYSAPHSTLKIHSVLVTSDRDIKQSFCWYLCLFN